MVEPHCSNFRLITTVFLGVQMFRNFTVFKTMHPIIFCRGLSDTVGCGEVPEEPDV